MKKWFGAMVTGAAFVVASTPAQAACWSNVAYEAAQVREFETMMMVSMLRCRISSTDFTASYNKFVVSKRPVLTAINNELRAQFAQTVGAARAAGAFDDYMTKVANSYGAGAPGLSCSEAAGLLNSAVAAAPTRNALVEIAERAGSTPRLPGGKCDLSVAFKSTR